MARGIAPKRRNGIGMRGAALLSAALAGLALGLAGIWQLEAARAGLTITRLQAGTTPLTVYR
ncbi:MAG: alpha/beta hydrolase, partial [Bradyrhizobium sp.]